MRPLLSTLILLTALPAPAQPDTAHWSMQGPLDAFTTDDLGNLYTVKGNELDLYDRTGAHRAHNSLLTFGSISRIDGFSSMKPMIFSRTQGQLAVLDNTLSVQGSPINLPAAGFSAISAACMGVQNRYWLYDERKPLWCAWTPSCARWPVPAVWTSCWAYCRIPRGWKKPMNGSTWWIPILAYSSSTSSARRCARCPSRALAACRCAAGRYGMWPKAH